MSKYTNSKLFIGYKKKISYSYFSGTIRENILFGLEYDAVKYEKVIADCALEDDFLEINGGDSVHIGGAGGNLSGGQMQRLNLGKTKYTIPNDP